VFEVLCFCCWATHWFPGQAIRIFYDFEGVSGASAPPALYVSEDGEEECLDLAGVVIIGGRIMGKESRWARENPP